MYEAKGAGRNRVAVARGDAAPEKPPARAPEPVKDDAEPESAPGPQCQAAMPNPQFA